MAKYKVGDKIRIVDKWVQPHRVDRNGCMDKWRGRVMTVRKVEMSSFGCSVYRMKEDAAEYFGGGWYWYEDMIAGLASETPEPKSDEKIVIFRDGNSVVARHYVGKRIADEAVATCSKDDEFDFNYGASLAAHRLFADARKHTVLSDLRKRLNDGGMAIVSVLSSLRGNL